MTETSLSHCPVSVQNAPEHKRKRVHFAACTTDIIASLYDRAEFTFAASYHHTREQKHCRPILKYSENMTAYIRRAGSSFARALSALGTWCAGVTSENPNVRSDMYKQLVAQIRGVSPHLRQAGESVLCENVHGMWVQLVEDFSIRREQYTPQDIELFENAAQVIGIIFSNHRFLARLDVLDVQTLVLEIITRVDLHIESKALPDRRFQSHLWLLGCEVSGWWESQSTLYSESLCTKLYNIISRINILSSVPPVQKSLLEIFRLVFLRYPNLKGIDVCSFLDLSWNFMWHEDEGIKKAARHVITLIADHRGGHLDIFQVVKYKCRTPALFHYELFSRVEDELRVLPADGLELWMIITRLVKDNIINLAQDRLSIWLIVPQHKLRYKVSGKMAGIMVSYLVHYCQAQIERSQDMYNAFALPFQQRTRNPRTALKALDTCLNAFYWDSPLQEPLPVDRERQRPNLKMWARFTADALNFQRQLLTTDELNIETDLLIGRIFCHWDNLIRALVTTQTFKNYDDDKKIQDIMDICNVGGKAFGERIQDEFNSLGKCSKHAVHVFWYNLMATTISLDKDKSSIFPVEILRSVLPMILGGLRSTQLRIRQHTYRFVTHGPILGGIRWLVEKDSLELLKAIDFAREQFESASTDTYGFPVTQINDLGIIMDQFVENGRTHLMSLKPLVKQGGDEVRWVWFDPDGKEFELGTEAVFTNDEREKLSEILEDRAKREEVRLKKKAEKDKGKKPKRMYDIKELTALVNSKEMRLGLLVDASKVVKETSPGKTPKSSGGQTSTTKVALKGTKGPVTTAGQTPVSSQQSNRSNPGSATTRAKQSQPSVTATNNPSPAPPVPSSLPSQPLPLSQASVPLQSSPPSTYDKRMPPPPVNWRPASQNTPKPAQNSTTSSPQREAASGSKARPSETRTEIVLDEMVQEVEEGPSGAAPSSVTRKRSRQTSKPSIEEVSKKRKLKSNYCPAMHTSWKPAWLETMQCYPVDQDGEDMSDAKCLNGDGIHRNADKLKEILETECMYITSHRVDEMMTLVEDTYNALKRTKEFYDEHPNKKIRIERHQVTQRG